MHYGLIILIVLFAALIKGSTGFGFSLITLPILLFWFPVKLLIPVLMAGNLFTSLIIVLQKKSRILLTRQSRVLILWGVLGTMVGTLFLNSIPEDFLTVIIAVLFAILSVLSLIGVRFKIKNLKWATMRAGVISGILAGSISVGGPPLTIFLNSLKTNNDEFREIFAWFSIFTAVIALIGYYFSGYIRVQNTRLALIFIPILFIGTYVGKRLNSLIPRKLFLKLTIGLSFVTCVLLLINELKCGVPGFGFLHFS